MRNVTNVMCAFLCTFTVIAFAQINPTKTLDLESNASQIFIHSSTGIPIFQTNSGYVAIHPEKQDILWKTS